MAGPCVWIVVLNWNGLVDTLACLESLGKLRYEPRRVVVVDNGSTDGSVSALRQAVSSCGFDLVEAGKNLGYAGGNNLGIRYALDRQADFVLVLNNDTTVDPTLLQELLSAAARNPSAGCFAPWIFYLHDRERVWFTRSEWSPAKNAFTAPGKGQLVSELRIESTDTDYVCGAALFFRASVARKIGLFDERFFLVYEDTDWCCRARRAGFGCLSVPNARVWHKVASSFGSEASPLRTYFSTRNKLLWAEKNASPADRWRAVRRALARLNPSAPIDRSAGSPHKVLWWALRAYLREWSRKARDPQEIAHRRGVLDYALRRFGDCPPQIRTLTGRWSGMDSPQAVEKHV